jgi:putative alpha-1,2-mannosidase
MYVYVPGEAWRTQRAVAQLMRTYYTPKTDGLPGNDDAGAMSAWWVLSALGFYPVCVGRGDFVIGTPHFDSATLAVPGAARALTIEAANLSATNMYVQHVRWAGEHYSRGWVTRQMIRGGGTLSFEMGPAPNTSWPEEPPAAC